MLKNTGYHCTCRGERSCVLSLFGNIACSKKHFNYQLQRNPHTNQKTKGNYRVVFGRTEQADNWNAKHKLPVPLESTKWLLEYAPWRFDLPWLLLYATTIVGFSSSWISESTVSSSFYLCPSLPSSFPVFPLLLLLENETVYEKGNRSGKGI